MGVRWAVVAGGLALALALLGVAAVACSSFGSGPGPSAADGTAAASEAGEPAEAAAVEGSLPDAGDGGVDAAPTPILEVLAQCGTKRPSDASCDGGAFCSGFEGPYPFGDWAKSVGGLGGVSIQTDIRGQGTLFVNLQQPGDYAAYEKTFPGATGWAVCLTYRLKVDNPPNSTNALPSLSLSGRGADSAVSLLLGPIVDNTKLALAQRASLSDGGTQSAFVDVIDSTADWHQIAFVVREGTGELAMAVDGVARSTAAVAALDGWTYLDVQLGTAEPAANTFAYEIDDVVFSYGPEAR
jgi:hypothetical protein